MAQSRPPVDTSKIAGNASASTKAALGDIRTLVLSRRHPAVRSPTFGESVEARVRVTEISIHKKREEERKVEARVVMEVEVAGEMLNEGGSIHGGCSAFLVDLCSSVALLALPFEASGKISPSVSQSLNIIYHSPARLGEKLRIVNTTLTAGARTLSARTEIWNVSKHRLVVSGTQVKMAPSPERSKL